MARRRFNAPDWVVERRRKLARLDAEIAELDDLESAIHERLAAADSLIKLHEDAARSKVKTPGWLSNLLFATGLSTAVIAFGGKIAEDRYFGDEDAVCTEANEVMRDDKLNADIPEQDKTRYLEMQVKNAIFCANRISN